MNEKTICTRCIYDESIPYISFDLEGVCNYCRQHENLEKEYPTGEEGQKKLELLAEKIRQKGRNCKYDVIIGVSGGADSSYLVYLAKELGLRPLAAHFDNTWNSRIAVENIQNVLKKLDVDLFTHVVKNNEYNDIFKSFLKASVPESDIVADIGLATTHYLAARKYGVKYIFEGHSFRTEGITPHGWVYMDAQYIKSVQEKFGTHKLETFPNLWILPWLKWTVFNGIKKLRPLYYIDYNKEKAMKLLETKFGWQWYGGHHMENRTSYFANNYYLPRKFSIDLRYPELSAMVRAGQKTREEAIEEIQKPHIFDEGILVEIKKRLGFTDEQFEQVMQLPPRSYRDYKTYKQSFENMRWLFWIMYKLNLVPKSFYMKYTRKYEY